MLSIRSVKDIDVVNKKVLFRVDLNVPLVNDRITNDFRLRSITKTLDYLLSKKSTIILVTHLGNPKKSPAPSTQLLIPWFEQQGYTISFASDLHAAKHLSSNGTSKIILLENIRLFPGEQNLDVLFAQELADLADCYLSDAFGAMHRNEASLVITPTLFAPERKGAGFLLQEEIKHLDDLKNPAKPLTLVLGGAKASTKIPLIKQFLNKADHILLCPALVFTFLAARHEAVGKSLVDAQTIPECHDIMQQAAKSSTKISFPIDYVVSKTLFEPPFAIVEADKMEMNDYAVAIGPQTMEQYRLLLSKSKTIFFNGIMGDLAHKDSLEQAHELFKAIVSSQAMTVVAGGDSVGAVYQFNLQHNIGYISTGGGAALAYLAGQELPGLIALLS